MVKNIAKKEHSKRLKAQVKKIFQVIIVVNYAECKENVEALTQKKSKGMNW